MDACRDPGDSEAELRAAGALRGTQQHRAASQTSLTPTDTALPTSGINQERTELGTELQPPPPVLFQQQPCPSLLSDLSKLPPLHRI